MDAPQNSSGYLYLGAGDGQLTKVSFNGSAIGTPALTAQPQFTSGGATASVSNKLLWSKAGVLDASIFSGGSVGAPWVTNNFNTWFNASTMTGAFYLGGRLFYTTASSDTRTRPPRRRTEPISGRLA